MVKKIIKKFFRRKEVVPPREHKKNRDHNVQFKGGKPTDIEIGDYSYMNGLIVYSWGKQTQITIGKICSIADEVTIIAGGEHHKKEVSTFPFLDRWELSNETRISNFTKGNITIGHDVWVGHGATLLSGVSIGHGAIFGAKAVVAKNVPAYAIVVGNPAKVISYRFSNEVIESLLAINWWDWSAELIEKEIELFKNTEEFLEVYSNK